MNEQNGKTMELYVGQRFSNHWHEDGYEIVAISENYVTMKILADGRTFEVPKTQLLATKPGKYEY